MEKLAFKPWERGDIRHQARSENGHVDGIQYHPDCIKQLWDANTFYNSLLRRHRMSKLPNNIMKLISLKLHGKRIVIVVFVVLLLAAARVMLRQTQYLNDAIANAQKPICAFGMDCKDEYGDVAVS